MENKFKVEITTDTLISKEATIFFTDAKLYDKPYYFFPKNIFQVENCNKFYIIDCYFDYGYSGGSRAQRDNGTSNQFWGYAKTDVDYGSLLVRPITKMDSLIDRFFSTDIKVDINKEFDNKYYVATNKSNQLKFLNKEFIDIAAKSGNLYIYLTKGNLLIGFLDKITTPDKVLTLCKLLDSMTFIETPIQR